MTVLKEHFRPHGRHKQRRLSLSCGDNLASKLQRMPTLELTSSIRSGHLREDRRVQEINDSVSALGFPYNPIVPIDEPRIRAGNRLTEPFLW